MDKYISNYFDLLYNLLTFLTYAKYCNYYIRINDYNRIKYFINFSLMIIFQFFISLFPVPFIGTVITVSIFVFNKFTFQITFKKNIYHIIRFDVFFYFPFVIAYIIVTICFDSRTLLNNNFYQNLKMAIICVIIYIIFSIFFSNKNANNNHLKNPYKKYIYILLCLIIVILCALALYSISLSSGIDKLQEVILITFMINIMIIVLIMTIHEKIVEFLQQSSLEQLKLQQYELNQNFYDELSEKSRQLCSLHHDFKNHIGVIQGNLKHNKYNEAMTYLDSIVDYANSACEVIITNNHTVSSIIMAKKSECERKEIRLKTEILFEKIYKITDMDLTIILGNILDNAIYAASKDLPENREINLTIKQIDSFLSVLCINNFIEKPIEKYGELKSIKRNATSHGIGLKNVFEICKKYNGEGKYTYDDRFFTINLLLSNH